MHEQFGFCYQNTLRKTSELRLFGCRLNINFKRKQTTNVKKRTDHNPPLGVGKAV